MVDAADFLDDENWHGGYYELAIDLGERAEPNSDLRLRRALTALWDDDRLDGCYLDRWTFPSRQERLTPENTDLTEPPPLHGVALLPDGNKVVCASHAIREIEVEGHVSHDWLDLSLPLGALSRVDSRVGAYPFDEDGTSVVWRRAIEEFLLDAARRVSASTSFRLALIGFEVSGAPESESFTGRPPDDRWVTYVLPMAGGDIQVFPANRTN